MIASAEHDMLSNSLLSPIDRNRIWREHIVKENSHSRLRETFSLNPSSAATHTITQKPHQPYTSRLSNNDFTQYEQQSIEKYTQAKGVNNGVIGVLNTGVVRGVGGGNTTSRIAGSQIVGNATQHNIAYAAEMKKRMHGQQQHQRQSDDITQGVPIEETVDLLHPLHGSQLAPRSKFAFPMTSSQEYGWISEPLIKPDPSSHSSLHHDGNYIGRTSSEVTNYAQTYIAQNRHSPFVQSAQNNSAYHQAPTSSSRHESDTAYRAKNAARRK